jgi:phosphoglycolate phosphatase-like HAD superfamily hydrolase
MVMPVDAIISDWNGTIIKYRNERPILENVAIDVFKASIPFHPLRMARIFKARIELESLYRKWQQNSEVNSVPELFKIYNKKIVNGTPVSIIRSSIDEYATQQYVQSALDHRILRSIKECHTSGKPTGILSAGYKYGIERILTVAGYHKFFDFYEADSLEEADGKAIKFRLDIYNKKANQLLKLLRERSIEATKVAYLGDSEDDEGCFEIVGYPVLALLAPEELKDIYAEKYKAFVPEDETDLVNYLKHT